VFQNISAVADIALTGLSWRTQIAPEWASLPEARRSGIRLADWRCRGQAGTGCGSQMWQRFHRLMVYGWDGQSARLYSAWCLARRNPEDRYWL